MKTDYMLLNEAGDYYKGNPNYPFSEEVYKIIGACMEVHSILGKGFLEIVYKEAMIYEFKARKIPFEREKRLDVHYKDVVLPRHYFADFYVFDEVAVEVKAQDGIVESLYKQAVNYLAACKKPLGLLINFGEDSLKFKRVILTKN
jgi:GxxExxY protein